MTPRTAQVARRDADPAPEGGHDFDRVESGETGHRLVCRCGWTTDLAQTAQAIGRQWDEHRRRAIGST